MDTTSTECPNCHTAYKSGIFNFVVALEDKKTKLINLVNDTKTAGYCNKCGESLYDSAKQNVNTELENLKQRMLQSINLVPVISAQHPLNWEYDVLSMVTGQSVTGTGVISEFFSSWTDLFGAQSNSYNAKLKQGENLCFAQLRKQALDVGGNAVIATDIDYSEVGGDKGMLMVCMAGTAIRVKNTDVFGLDRADKLLELSQLNSRFRQLKSLT